jgi:hypothetical protein
MMNMVLSAAIEAQAGEALEISSRAMQLRDRFLGYGVEPRPALPPNYPLSLRRRFLPGAR